MTKYYFKLKASTGDNVGDIEADSEEKALEEVTNIYAPANPISGKPHAGIEVEIISKSLYDSEKKRIEKARYEEANAPIETTEANSEVVES
jgi:hypothetical protein